MRAIVVMVVLAVAGCATVRGQDALAAEQVLAAAGFHMKLADTPEKLARLQTLTPGKLVPHQRDGRLYFVYADPDFCKCLYVGTEQNYQEYQRLGLQRRLADEQLMAAQTNLYAPMSWEAWGPWPW
ncbi:MAG TPA: hypothetical protein VIG37_21860 [Methylomirabilota bacterium]|jgi:hypothetical protein